MTDRRSLFLLVLSFALVATWIYHLYDKNIYSRQKKIVYVKDTAAFQQHTHDSLQRIYLATLRDLPIAIDSMHNNADSAQSPLDSQRIDIYLRSKEVAALLNKKIVDEADLDLARQKIAQLQQQAARYLEPADNIAADKAKLNDLLRQLNAQFEKLQQNLKALHEKK